MKPGTGQGLYLARNVIQAHGGRIELKSAAGVGTAVAVHLPLTSEVTLELSRRTLSTSSQKVSISARHKNDRRA
jgi:K+-sensing histidine kinase KdpD